MFFNATYGSKAIHRIKMVGGWRGPVENHNKQNIGAAILSNLCVLSPKLRALDTGVIPATAECVTQLGTGQLAWVFMTR